MRQGKVDRSMQPLKEQWADGIACGATSAAWMLLVYKIVRRPGQDLWNMQNIGEVAEILGSRDSDDGGESTEQLESAGALQALDSLRDALVSLFQDYARHDSSMAEFLEGDADRALHWLLQSSVGDDFRRLLERHGHRCVKEAEMRNRSWKEDPTVLVQLLQTSVKAKLLPGRNGKHAVARGSTICPSDRETKHGVTLEEMMRTRWSHVSCIFRPLLRLAVSLTKSGVMRRELGKSLQVKAHDTVKRAYRIIAEKAVQEGILQDEDLVYFFTHDEVGQLLRAKEPYERKRMIILAQKRRMLMPALSKLRFDELVQGVPGPIENNAADGCGHSAASNAELWNGIGTPVSSGIAEAPARVITTLDEANTLQPGEIMICQYTDVGWTPYFSLASGVVTEIGGLLSHGAVVAREFGLPCVVGVRGATARIKSGSIVRVEGDTGKVTVLTSS